MTNLLKCVNLEGDLNSPNQILTYNLININFRRGLWFVSIRDICYENNGTVQLNSIARIKCNLVRDHRNFERLTQSFLPSIGTILFKGDRGEKRITYFDAKWYQVNSPEDVLKISFEDPSSEEKIQINCNVYVSILLKQIL